MVAMIGPDGHGSFLALRICVLLPEIFRVPWGFHVRAARVENMYEFDVLTGCQGQGVLLLVTHVLPHSQTRGAPRQLCPLRSAAPRYPIRGLAVTSWHYWTHR